MPAWDIVAKVTMALLLQVNTHLKWTMNNQISLCSTKVSVNSPSLNFNIFKTRLSGLFDYLDFFLWLHFLWILISCHLENSKLQIDQLNPFKRLLKQHIIFVQKSDEKFLKKTNMLEYYRVYEYLHKKWISVKNH